MPEELNSPEQDVELLGGEESEESEDIEDTEGEGTEGTPESEDEPEPSDSAREDFPPHERPSIKEINEKFPEFFKSFPSLRDMYFREKEYSNLFPSISDAKLASENSDAFLALQESVIKGDGSQFMTSLKEANGLTKFSSQFLPTLHKISPDDHWKTIAPLLQNVTRVFYSQGDSRNDDNLRNAALLLSDFLFGDVNIANGKRSIAEERAPEVSTVKNEREEFEREKYNSFYRDVNSSGVEGLRAIISEKIDPDNLMSNFIKESVVDKIFAEVGKQMQADPAHIRYMDNLWSKAKLSSYSGDWKARIVSAYLARAKSIVPTVRSKYVSEALGTASRISTGKGKKLEALNSRKEGTSAGRSAMGEINSKKVDWSKTSDTDFLAGNITYRS